jgi:hypothetical protein
MISAGIGMTSAGADAGAATAAPNARLKKRAAARAATLRSRTILGPCRTIHTLLDRLVRRPMYAYSLKRKFK